MMSPTAPLVNRQLVWHLYSAQAYGIFHGDLGYEFLAPPSKLATPLTHHTSVRVNANFASKTTFASRDNILPPSTKKPFIEH